MDGVTSGALAGTNGKPAGAAMLRNSWRTTYAACALLLLAAGLVNITSALHDLPPGVAAWKPFTWEGSSYVGSLASLWIAFRAMGLAPFPTPRWGRALAIHAAAASLYSSLHCAVMWTVRNAVYALAGAPYHWGGPSQFFYEYRKDLITYIVVSGLYWCVCRLADSAAAAPSAPLPDASPALPESLDIRDGTRLVRAPIATILAAESAGNYATILLADGRRPLMRTTLAALEEKLAPHGFVRVHRSWLIHPAHLRQMDPSGTGDYKLTLHGGLTVPLSRRYAGALREGG